MAQVPTQIESGQNRTGDTVPSATDSARQERERLITPPTMTARHVTLSPGISPCSVGKKKVNTAIPITKAVAFFASHPENDTNDLTIRRFCFINVRCKDEQGRQFLVEMQMIWSEEFKQCVLFNASKAYVRQLDRSENFELLQPVYSLNLVNEVFEPNLPNYYHQYAVANIDHPDVCIHVPLHFIAI